MSEKLKSCPFCGGEATYWLNNVGGISVGCLTNYRDIDHPRCLAEPIVTIFRRDVETAKEEAIKAWNTRPNPWHTEKPTEEGYYVLIFPNELGFPDYCVGYWNGEKFLIRDAWEGDEVKLIAWAKIEPYK